MGISPENELAIGTMAILTGMDLPYDEAGLRTASEMADRRRQELYSPYSRERLKQHIINHSSRPEKDVIQYFIDTAKDAFSQKNHTKVLEVSNLIYVYGMVDLEEGLGGEVFLTSLKLHRRMTYAMVSPFTDTDSTLKGYYDQLLNFRREVKIAEEERAKRKKKQVKKVEDYITEINASRGLVHTVALKGYLGEEAKKFVDPFAIQVIW